jgi:hypothetical protein
MIMCAPISLNMPSLIQEQASWAYPDSGKTDLAWSTFGNRATI